MLGNKKTNSGEKHAPKAGKQASYIQFLQRMTLEHIKESVHSVDFKDYRK